MVKQLQDLTTPNTNATGYHGMRHVAVRSTDSRIYAVWQSDNGAVYSYSDDEGDNWSTPTQIAYTYPSTSKEVSIWADGSGNIHFAYVGNKSSATYRSILYRKLDSSNNMGTELEVCYSSGYDQKQPSIATYSNFSYGLITWMCYGIQGTNKTIPNVGTSVWSGSSWGTPWYQTDAAHPQENPVALVDDGVCFYVFWWSTYTPPRDAEWYGMTKKCTPPSTWGSNTPESDYDPQAEAYFDHNNNFHKVYRKSNGTTYDIKYRTRTSTGSWGTEETVYTESNCNMGDCSLAVDSSGNVHVALLNVKAAEVDVVYRQRVSGSWQTKFDVDTTLTSANYPRLAPTRPLVIYYDADNSAIRYTSLAKPTQTAQQVGDDIQITFGDG